jgi:hypothetical protein
MGIADFGGISVSVEALGLERGVGRVGEWRMTSRDVNVKQTKLLGGGRIRRWPRALAVVILVDAEDM